MVGAGLWRHEMWRDELQAWMIARDSASLPELWTATRPEGHPLLWYLLLFAVTRITRAPVAMQALHLLLAAGAAFLVLRHAPFARWQRLALVCGYFLLYEYAVISRGYVLGTLGCFAFCALRSVGRDRPRDLIPVLVLLANTSVYGGFLAGALAVFQFTEWRLVRGTTWRMLTAPALVFTAGVAVSALQMAPPAGGSYAPLWIWRPSGHYGLVVFATLFRAYVPFPRTVVAFWDTNVAMDSIPSPAAGLWVGALLSLALFLACGWMLFRRRSLLLAYVVGTLALLVFGYVKYLGALRHHGALFLLLVACLWLAGLPAGGTPPTGVRRSILFAFLLVVHVAAAAWAFAMDWVHPFSSAAAAAKLVRNRYPEAVLVGRPDYTASGIAGYLDRPIYYPDRGDYGTYVRWYGRRAESMNATLATAERLLAESGRDVLLVLNHPLEMKTERGLEPVGAVTLRGEARLTRVAAFSGSIVTDEDLQLYLVSRAGVSPASSPAPPSP